MSSACQFQSSPATHRPSRLRLDVLNHAGGMLGPAWWLPGGGQLRLRRRGAGGMRKRRRARRLLRPDQARPDHGPAAHLRQLSSRAGRDGACAGWGRVQRRRLVVRRDRGAADRALRPPPRRAPARMLDARVTRRAGGGARRSHRRLGGHRRRRWPGPAAAGRAGRLWPDRRPAGRAAAHAGRDDRRRRAVAAGIRPTRRWRSCPGPAWPRCGADRRGPASRCGICARRPRGAGALRAASAAAVSPLPIRFRAAGAARRPAATWSATRRLGRWPGRALTGGARRRRPSGSSSSCWRSSGRCSSSHYVRRADALERVADAVRRLGELTLD